MDEIQTRQLYITHCSDNESNCKRALNIGDRQGVVGGNGDNCTWTTIINKQINK